MVNHPNRPPNRLRHHVTGAIERGEKLPIVEQLDWPVCRASLICPICELDKPKGLIMCWPCYRLHDVRYGISGQSRVLLTAMEYAGRLGNA